MYNQINPYQPMMNYQYQNQSIQRVNGIDGAKAYQLGAGQTMALFDSNEDLFYLKSCDNAGFPTIRVFKFEELSEFDKKQDFNTDFVSKEEFETFKKEVAEYVQQFISKPKSNFKTTDKSTDN